IDDLVGPSLLRTRVTPPPSLDPSTELARMQRHTGLLEHGSRGVVESRASKIRPSLKLWAGARPSGELCRALLQSKVRGKKTGRLLGRLRFFGGRDGPRQDRRQFLLDGRHLSSHI